MLKGLLFSLALATVVLSTNAQVTIKQGTKFSKNTSTEASAKISSKDKGVAKSLWVIPQSENNFQVAVDASQHTGVRKADAKTTQIWWQYPGSGITSISFKNGATDFNAAIYVPAKLAGAKVDSLSAYFFGKSQLASDVTMWISEVKLNAQGQIELPEPGSYDKTYTLKKSDVIDGKKQGNTTYLSPSKLALPETYTIPANGCFLGYSFKAATNAKYPLMLFSGNEVDGGAFIYQPGNGWGSLTGAGFGNLTLAVHADVTGLTSAEVSADGIIETPIMIGKKGSIPAKVTNNGFSPVSSLSYVATIDGVAQPETEYTFTEDEGTMQSYTSAYLQIPYKPESEGVKAVSLKITKVNGIANTDAKATNDDGEVLALAEQATRTSVVEEATGTWCGWCPRGHVGLERLNKDLGDKVITLAAHVGQNNANSQEPDAMTTADMQNATGDYYAFQYFMTGGSAPVALFDRYISGDPYYGLGTTSTQTATHYGATDVVEAIQKSIPSEADVKLNAAWSDDNMTSINADVTTTFKIDRDAYPYGIIFVLSADSLKNPEAKASKLWSQLNYYSPSYGGGTGFGDDDMAKYVNGPAYVTDQVYNHVIVGAWAPEAQLSQTVSVLNVVNGDTEPFEEAFQVKDQPLDFSKTLELSSSMKNLIQRKDLLSLTAILVNNNNGQIVNAAQVKLTPAAGIKGIANESDINAKEVARYNANGQLLKAPQKGLNIIKLSNGKSLKVVVK